MDQLKILFTISHAFNPYEGGVQRTTFKLGKYFSEKGIKVYYYSLASERHIVPEYGDLFFPAKDLSANETYKYQHLAKTIENLKPDIVINQNPYDVNLRRTLKQIRQHSQFVLLGCLRNSLFSFKNNAFDIVRRNSPKMFRNIVSHKFPLAAIQMRHKIKHKNELLEILRIHDKFILLTPANNIELKYFVGNQFSEKIVAIPNSIPSVLPEYPKKDKTFLFVGNLNIYQKKADLLLPIWERIYKKLPDWNFIIVGDGDYKSKMDSYIQERNIPRVTLKGRCNPEKYYKSASVLIMPSAFEGFPNVLIEAQSFGLVPFAFNSYEALNWIINNEIDGFSINPFNIEELSEKAVSLANDSLRLEKMGQNALENAKRFVIEKVGEEWLNFFTEFGYSNTNLR